MAKLMELSNGQFLVTVPGHIVRTLQARKGDKMEFHVNIKKGTVEIEKK